jgi:hypothetical protein
VYAHTGETITHILHIDPKQATATAIAVFILLAIFAVLRLADCRQWNGGQIIIEIFDSADYHGFFLALVTTKWAQSLQTETSADAGMPPKHSSLIKYISEMLLLLLLL